mgnify:FL=1
MKFKYKKYAPGILRPVIPVEISYKDSTVPYEVLVDSGADFCIFDSQIGDLLDIPLLDGERHEVSGITGVAETYYTHAVTLIIGGWFYKAKVGFLSNIANLGYGVVGQRGFFDNFIVKFDLVKEEVELKLRK